MNCNLITAAVVGAALLVSLFSAVVPAMKEFTKEEILSSSPEWQERYDQYTPPPDMIDALKERLASGMRIDVYLGLWCSDSRTNVPLFIKILDRAGTSVPVRYFEVPRKASKDIKYFVEDLKVERVPTFIFYRNGGEIGRITENPKATLLEDIMEIAFK